MTSISCLSGVKVLELGEGWTTALAGKLLADLGADVTKLEVPWGDVLRSYGRDESECAAAFALPNSGKRLVSGTEAIASLQRDGFADTDVVLVDAHVAERLRLDVDAVGQRVVACRFSPFDLRGPWARLAANDLTLQALSGVMATTGEPRGRPLRSGTELSSVLGALYGTIGTLAALIERERSSLGQIVDVSLYDCLVSTLTNFASRVLGGQPELGRLGNQGPNSAPWELFEASDGEYIFIIAGSPPTFERLTATMGRLDLLADPRFADPISRRENYLAVTAVVAEWVKTLSRDEVVALLRANGVPVSPVATIPELLADSHLRSRGMLSVTTDDAGRRQLSMGQPLGFSHAATDGHRPGSEVGSGARSLPEGGPDRVRALAGLRVVDFGTLTACPWSTRLLANLGADVLKIEPLVGEAGRHFPPLVDGESVFFHITNNGKRSLSVNLRNPDDVALVRKILSRADVLIENQAPGALSKRGLGAEPVMADNPHLIYTSVSGYGHEGVLGGLRAYDTVIQAGAGLMSLTGEDGGRPLKTGISSADVVGALAATTASLGAYFGRITGRHDVRRLDVSLFDITAWSIQMALVTELSGLGAATRHGNGHWLFAPYGVFETADQERLAIACETEEQWRSLVAVLVAAVADQCAPGLASWSRAVRWSRRQELEALLQSYCGSRTADSVVSVLQERAVPASRVAEVSEVLTTQQTAAPTTVDMDGRSWRVTDFPLRLSATPGMVTTPGPPLGHENKIIRQYPDTAWENVFDS